MVGLSLPENPNLLNHGTKTNNHPLTLVALDIQEANHRGQYPLTHTVLYPRTMTIPLPITSLPLEALIHPSAHAT